MADSTIKSVRRAFEVLEYFEEVAKPLSLKEVAARFGYPTSSTAAMLKSLMLLGYLNYDARSRTYIPTLRLAELGTWAKDALLHEELLRTTIARLSARTRETVSVGTQSDVYMQYLHVAYPDEPLQFHVKPGTVRLLTR